MYADLNQVRKLLNPIGGQGTLTGGIIIGVSGSCSSAFGSQCCLDAGTFIDGMLFQRFTTPFGSPPPAEIRWIANRLAASYIMFAVKQYKADSASNFLYDKQQLYYQMAMSKLQALADGTEKIRGAKDVTFPSGSDDGNEEFEFTSPGSSNLRPASPEI